MNKSKSQDEIGAALSVYAKYPSIFEFWREVIDDEDSDRQDFSWLEEIDPDDFLKKVNSVCGEAITELGELKASVHENLTKSLPYISINPKRKRHRVCVSRTQWGWNVKGRRRRIDSKVTFGVNFKVVSNDLIATPWLWMPGGKRSAESIFEILGSNFTVAGTGWYSGNVVYNEPILISAGMKISEFQEAILKAFNHEEAWPKILKLGYS